MRQRLNNCMVTCNTCFRNYRCYFCISCLVDLLQFSALRGGSPRSKHHNLYRLWSLNGSLDHHRHSILECRVSDALLRQFIDSVRTWSCGEFFNFYYKVLSFNSWLLKKVSLHIHIQMLYYTCTNIVISKVREMLLTRTRN